MRKIVLLFTAIVFSSALFAQNPIDKGQFQFNAGFGFSSWGVPIYAGVDYGVHPDITIGGEFSFRTYNDKFAGEKYIHTIFGIIANGNYHFNSLLEMPSNWDLYAGLSLGFYFWNSSNDYPGDHSSGTGLGLQVGGRYYFNEKFGLNLELGGGTIGAGKFGVSFRF